MTDNPVGPIAYAAFQHALIVAGPAGLSSSWMGHVVVPGRGNLRKADWMPIINQLVSRGRCEVVTVRGETARLRDNFTIYRHSIYKGKPLS